jgi:hypothetical protein
MAHYTEGSHKGFIAGADLSSSQFLIVKLNGSNQIVLAAAATDISIGVLTDKPTLLRTGDVRLRTAAGTANVKIGGTVAVGDALTSNASGQAITTVTAGNQVLGYALEAGTVGQVIEFLPCVSKV